MFLQDVILRVEETMYAMGKHGKKQLLGISNFSFSNYILYRTKKFISILVLCAHGLLLARLKTVMFTMRQWMHFYLQKLQEEKEEAEIKLTQTQAKLERCVTTLYGL